MTYANPPLHFPEEDLRKVLSVNDFHFTPWGREVAYIHKKTGFKSMLVESGPFDVY